KSTITINWPAWRETGMALNYNVDFSKEVFIPIKNEEAINALSVMLKKDVSNVVIGELNYNNFKNINSGSFILDISPQIIKQIISRDLSKSTLQSKGKNDNKTSSVILKGRDTGDSYTDSEKKIANI